MLAWQHIEKGKHVEQLSPAIHGQHRQSKVNTSRGTAVARGTFIKKHVKWNCALDTRQSGDQSRTENKWRNLQA